MNNSEKIQKVLANRGIGSRRQIETLIAQGKVWVNGHVAEIGERINANTAKIKVNGRSVSLAQESEQETEIIVYNKPVGEICSRNDPEKRPTVFKNLPKLKHGRWVAVGRLDFNTSGLLLFTNNGELAHRLMHPSFEMDREYAVRVFGEVDPETLNKLKTGVDIDGHIAKFTRIKYVGGEGTNKWYSVVLKEGKNREVRRLWEAVNIAVNRLVRTRYGDIQLPKTLRRAQHQPLTKPQIKKLMKAVGLD